MRVRNFHVLRWMCSHFSSSCTNMRHRRNSKIEALRRIHFQSTLVRCTAGTLSTRCRRLLTTGCTKPTSSKSVVAFSAAMLQVLYRKVREAPSLKAQRTYLAQLLKGLPHLPSYKTMEYQSFACYQDGTTVYFPTYEPRKGLEDVARSPLAVDSLSASTACVLYERGAYCLLHWGHGCTDTVLPLSRYENINKYFVNDIFVRCFERLFRGRTMSTFRNTVVIDCVAAGTTKAMSRLFSVLRTSSRKPYSHTIINWDTRIIAQARMQPHTSQCDFFSGSCSAYLECVEPYSLSATFFDWCSSYIGSKCSPQQDLELAFSRHVFTKKESVLAFTVCARTSSEKARTPHDIIQDVLQMAANHGYVNTSLLTYYSYCGGMRFFCFSVCVV